ncbi:AI-2E family transporter [Flavobacterium sp.]|uniref:AI-2E family transporter n=1 Tax=Flavobacterium sp. TaxID=239 RepID=UPI00286BEC34|nr:AI-2E family transporter [Flavobacterium sp.]
MKNAIQDYPLYIKLSLITMGLVAFFYILYIGGDIIVPLIFSVIIAILLNPIVNFLTRKKCNRVVSILIAVTATMLLIALLAYFIFSQAANLSESMPELKAKFMGLFKDSINWVAANFNVNHEQINQWITKTRSEILNNSATYIGTALTSFMGLLVLFFLLPVYIFMILFYKPLLLEFIAELFKNNQQELVGEVLTETKTLIQSYLVGLLFEAALVAILNSVGLLILGIEYAILIGVIGALLNFIPYIGGIVAICIPMLMAFATQTPIDALWAFLIYLFVQFIDNNFIVPKIVASKVKINALISIVVVLIGGAIWGIAGMFLAIPLTAIAKVIFDRITPLKPFGFLLGDNQPEIGSFLHVTIRKKRKAES